MPVKTKHPKTKAAVVALTLALAVPAAAQAMTSGPEGERAGYLWLDLVVVVGFLAGIILLGIWGDLVLGAVIGAIWTLVELCVRLVATALRGNQGLHRPRNSRRARRDARLRLTDRDRDRVRTGEEETQMTPRIAIPPGLPIRNSAMLHPRVPGGAGDRASTDA
jgi:hypothetical protein